jgi:hypothetical protein
MQRESNINIFKNIGSLFESLNTFLVSDELTRAAEINQKLEDATMSNYNELKSLLGFDSNSNLLKYTEYQNSQVLPFTLPFEGKPYAGEAVFSIVIALLVDVLSCFIAWVLIEKPKSILYYKNIKDARRNREERLENCLTYLCFKKISQANDLKEGEIVDTKVFNTLNGILNGFFAKLDYIYTTDSLNSFAYLSPQKVAKFDPDERLLFETLNNVALLHPVSKNELQKILEEEFSINNDNKFAEKLLESLNDNGIYYLVSKNFHVWFCENLSELIQNSQILNENKIIEESE